MVPMPRASIGAWGARELFADHRGLQHVGLLLSPAVLLGDVPIQETRRRGLLPEALSRLFAGARGIVALGRPVRVEKGGESLAW